jgi:hypothetical protein
MAAQKGCQRWELFDPRPDDGALAHENDRGSNRSSRHEIRNPELVRPRRRVINTYMVQFLGKRRLTKRRKRSVIGSGCGWVTVNISI